MVFYSTLPKEISPLFEGELELFFPLPHNVLASVFFFSLGADLSVSLKPSSPASLSMPRSPSIRRDFKLFLFLFSGESRTEISSAEGTG